jgi:hypothetical protein
MVDSCCRPHAAQFLLASRTGPARMESKDAVLCSLSYNPWNAKPKRERPRRSPCVHYRPCASAATCKIHGSAMLSEFDAGGSPRRHISVFGVWGLRGCHGQQSLRCHSLAESVASERRRNEAPHDRCRRSNLPVHSRLVDENTGGEVLLRLAERDPLPHWNEPRLRDDSAKIKPTVAETKHA